MFRTEIAVCLLSFFSVAAKKTLLEQFPNPGNLGGVPEVDLPGGYPHLAHQAAWFENCRGGVRMGGVRIGGVYFTLINKNQTKK